MARKYRRLRFEDRQKIEKGLREKKSIVEISTLLGVHKDTIYKELCRCGFDQNNYDAATAQQMK